MCILLVNTNRFCQGVRKDFFFPGVTTQSRGHALGRRISNQENAFSFVFKIVYR